MLLPPISRTARCLAAAFLSLVVTIPMANAQTQTKSSSLPGGASSLQETYGDWQVACIPGKDGRQCLVRQEQHKKDTKQLVLAAELVPAAEGDMRMTLVLPFGLNLADGVILQIDDGPASQAVPFTTCLPVGCLAILKVDSELQKSLKAGSKAKLLVRGYENGQGVGLALSLKGFTQATARLANLAKAD